MDKEKQQEEREKVQNMAEQLSKENKHLLLSWATGVGKGRAVMQCIAASPSPKRWLIVVPEILHIQNYKDDLVKHGFEFLLGEKIEDIICYASLKKWKGKALNLALNEAHHLSKLKHSLAGMFDFDQIVSDSATVPPAVKSRLYDLYPYYEYHISVDDAIERGILPPPRVICIGIELDDVIKRNTYKTKFREYTITDKEYSEYLDRQILYWSRRSDEAGFPAWMERKIVQFGTMRKKFLAGKKTEKAKELLKDLEGKRFICFTGTIEQATLLGGKKAIHSKRTKSVNLKTLQAFNDAEIDDVYMNRMGREGLNLEGIQAVVVIQLDSGKVSGLSFIQMTGRGLRADAPEIYILYAKKTQDAVFLDRALENIDKKYATKI